MLNYQRVLGNAAAWPRLQAMFQQRWRLLAAVFWLKSMAEISGISWEIAARNQQTV